jgi:cytidyltransferase-like protein
MSQQTERKKDRYGLVLGRFQPLHLGHMEYLNAAKGRSSHLVIGITNPDNHALVYDPADPDRSRPDNNPFSYFDRQQMISASLVESGWDYESFSIVPASINRPQDMKSFLPPPACTTAYITVYDEWGDKKAGRISSLGYAVDILWRREKNDRLTRGTDVRDMIRSGNAAWRELVPRAVSRYLDESGWGELLSDRTAPRRADCRDLPALSVDESPTKHTPHAASIVDPAPNLRHNVLDVRSTRDTPTRDGDAWRQQPEYSGNLSTASSPLGPGRRLG